jgi:hypothetical protein
MDGGLVCGCFRFRFRSLGRLCVGRGEGVGGCAVVPSFIRLFSISSAFLSCPSPTLPSRRSVALRGLCSMAGPSTPIVNTSLSTCAGQRYLERWFLRPLLFGEWLSLLIREALGSKFKDDMTALQGHSMHSQSK